MLPVREIYASDIIRAVRNLCIDANYYLSEDIKDKLKIARQEESWPIAKDMLDKIIQNAEIAEAEDLPMCQDTGMACVFVSIGQDVHVVGGSIEEAINQGVRQGYKEGYLRKSIVRDPLDRVNTGDNTPAVIYYDLVPGNKIKIVLAPKGFGSENMSKIKMLKPSDGILGVKEFIVETVKEAGPNPCPPTIIGVGIGGSFDKVAVLAKKALLRPLNKENSNPFYRDLEKELVERINETGIGPQGFGGRTTTLGVNIEVYPTHIAGLPVAVNVSCHATRHAEIII